jgi:hypothetical protein
MRPLVLSLIVSVGFLVVSTRAIRRKHLREQAAILWIAVSIVMVFLSATLPLHLLNSFARLVGIAYPPDLILLLAVLFLVVLVFHQSLALARLNERHTSLVQEIGILSAVHPAESPHENAPGLDAPHAQSAVVTDLSRRASTMPLRVTGAHEPPAKGPTR